MKTKLSLLFLIITFLASATAAQAAASATEEVVLKVKEMHCNNCKEKIMKNIRFEKGMKALKVDLETKTVTIKYDSKKTSVEKLQEAFTKLGYTTEVVKPQ